MKSFLAIARALVSAMLHPNGLPPVGCHTVWVVLFLIGRLILAISLSPAVLIAGMVSDSGTTVATYGASAIVYATSLLIWAALLFSWRCVAASICIFASTYLAMLICSERVEWLLAPILTILCVTITEALPAPIRTTREFLVWCSSSNNIVTNWPTMPKVAKECPFPKQYCDEIRCDNQVGKKLFLFQLL